jgi:coproporphyrinogen III oxidase-like Fe-S oxidoreductase
VQQDHHRQPQPLGEYVRYVGREIGIVSSLLEGERRVQQLHWGGGTPTFLAHEEMACSRRSIASKAREEARAKAGYVSVGMDHFAKPGDELAVALREGKLHRNFQGYSTRPDCDLIAFGMSAIGKIGRAYVQNVKTLDGTIAMVFDRYLAEARENTAYSRVI